MSPLDTTQDYDLWKTRRPKAFTALDPNTVSGAIAVIVFHGMGQQAQFETLNDVTNSFIEAHRERGWTIKRRDDPWLGHSTKGTVDLFKARKKSDILLPVGQITMESHDHKEQKFDFYEAYWAPLTEGQVGLWECFYFLLRAAADGMLASFVQHGFKRVIFGETKTYPISVWAGVQLLLAGLTVASLATIGWAYVVVVGEQVLEFLGIGLPHMMNCAGELRELLSRFLLTALVLLIPPLINSQVQKRLGDSLSRIARIANVVWVLPILLTLIYFGVAALISFSTHGGWDITDRLPMSVHFQQATAWGNVVFVLTGATLLWSIWYFTVKFLGDVVAYVSAHAVNRFWAVRERIQERCLRVAKGVYSRKEKQDSNKLLYEQVVIVSHSLGSVIAYDILNWLVTLEVCGGEPPCVTKVAERTRLFLTCGSPLNKIAFLFRFNTGLISDQKEWRDRLNNYRQPLILNYQWRPHRWINVWSHADWISGRLSYYELPKTRRREVQDWVATAATSSLAPRALKILNVPDPDAFVPLFSHTSYFKHKQFRTAIYDGIWSQAAPDWAPSNQMAVSITGQAKAAAQAAGA